MKNIFLTLLVFTHVAHAGFEAQPYKPPSQTGLVENDSGVQKTKYYWDEYNNRVYIVNGVAWYYGNQPFDARRTRLFFGVMKALLSERSYAGIQREALNRSSTIRSNSSLSFAGKTFHAISYNGTSNTAYDREFTGYAVKLPADGKDLDKFFPAPLQADWLGAIRSLPQSYYTHHLPFTVGFSQRGVRMRMGWDQGDIGAAFTNSGNPWVDVSRIMHEVNKEHYYISDDIIYHYDSNTVWQWNSSPTVRYPNNAYQWAMPRLYNYHYGARITAGPFDVVGDPLEELRSSVPPLLGSLELPNLLLENTYTGSTVSLGANFDQVGSGGKIVVDQSN